MGRKQVNAYHANTPVFTFHYSLSIAMNRTGENAHTLPLHTKQQRNDGCVT